jgi:hypothetical protein
MRINTIDRTPIISREFIRFTEYKSHMSSTSLNNSWNNTGMKQAPKEPKLHI